MSFQRVLCVFVRALLQKTVVKKTGSVQILRGKLEYHEGQLLAFGTGDQSTGILF